MKKSLPLNRSRKSSLTLIVAGLLIHSVAMAAGPATVDLGTSADYLILAKAGISTTGTTALVGDIGVSPNGSTSLTGFGLILDSSLQFATSPLITGKALAADYASPSPSILTTAISDMQTAFTDAAGRILPTATELGSGDISGMTIPPGTYKWSSGVLISSGVTLSGGAHDIWILQIGQNLTVENGAIITLSGGARPGNIYWQVAGETNIGTTAQFEGNILCQTAINLRTGATVNGRLLAQTAVTLDSNVVNMPSDNAGWSRGSNNLGEGWTYLDWFGFFHAANGPVDNWIYHMELNWLYAIGDAPDNIWFASMEIGWLWTNRETYPYFWRERDQAWLYYLRDSTSPRWFFNLKTELWEAY